MTRNELRSGDVLKFRNHRPAVVMLVDSKMCLFYTGIGGWDTLGQIISMDMKGAGAARSAQDVAAVYRNDCGGPVYSLLSGYRNVDQFIAYGTTEKVWDANAHLTITLHDGQQVKLSQESYDQLSKAVD